MLKKRQQEIKEKGFNLVREETRCLDMDNSTLDYSRMKVGMRPLDDAIVNLGTYKKVNSNYGSKQYVLNAIYRHDYDTLREISNYFYESNGIYYRLCKYFAFLYRYDWYVTPYIMDAEKEKEKKVLKDFSNVLLFLDKSEIKRIFSNIALDVIKEGVYYGLMLDFGDKAAFQKLPAKYCRCRYFSGTTPVVELNLQFFDAYFSNMQYKMRILELFPKDIQKAYILFKEGKLKGDYPGDRSYWYALDPAVTVRISLNDNDFPSLVGAIPPIIDLDQAQDLDRKKTMQQLLKIIVQKLPLDKNGDLIFDVDEALDIHNNAVAMLRRAIGIDVLTTFADIEKIDTKDSNSATTRDDLEKAERTVYNAFGASHNLFNAEGNMAVTNSILTDEASIRDLPLQFDKLLNRMIEKFNKKSHYEFRGSILETTQYNYKEFAKLYKEQAQLGYSKMLPQIALGHSQSSILATLTFENEVLHLAESMIPPMSSNTMSAKSLGNQSQIQKENNNGNTTTATSKINKSTSTDNTGGRPQKEDNTKSDKTIQNIESMS